MTDHHRPAVATTDPLVRPTPVVTQGAAADAVTAVGGTGTDLVDAARRAGVGAGRAGLAPLLLDVDEVSAVLGVGRSFIYELLKGELPYCKLGTRTKIPSSAVVDYVRRRLAEQSAADDALAAHIAARRRRRPTPPARPR